MGATMDPVFGILGVLSMLAGVVTIVVGVVLIAIKGEVRTYRVTVADWAKWLEPLGKLPRWAVAIVLGVLQIAVGAWLLEATLFGHRVLP
jgi:hypothetical protein